MQNIAMGAVAAIALAGCASRCPPKAAEPRYADAPLRDLTGLDMESRLGAYQARDAIWVSGQPLLVNRSYDFALAASDELGGPGLAAGLRRRANVALAERLSRMATISTDELLRGLVGSCGNHCEEVGAIDKVRLYGVLFGEKKARIRVVLEPRGSDEVAYWSIGPAMPTDSFERGDALRSAFQKGISRLASMLRRPLPHPSSPGVPGRCFVGDGENVAGTVTSDEGEYVIMASAELVRKTVVACPKEALRLAAPL